MTTFMPGTQISHEQQLTGVASWLNSLCALLLGPVRCLRTHNLLTIFVVGSAKFSKQFSLFEV